VRRSSGDLSSLLSLFHFSVKGNKAINQLIAIALARRYCQINLEVNPFPMPLFTAIVAILAFWLCLAVVWALLAEILLVVENIFARNPDGVIFCPICCQFDGMMASWPLHNRPSPLSDWYMNVFGARSCG